ncbi:MAG: amino acid adenylation domain-containing protein, partial [Bacteroidales bacterium]|nr:amino acid adenylation domain-containing protein [Bacteroidales bacterium]
DVKRRRLAIGQAIAGCRMLILDKNKNVCDIGIPGELYLRTPYASYGYYNDDQSTKEKFISNPFIDDDVLLYRTGDLAIENTSGEIEIIGRIDHQLKIRGFRIELGEIESTLLKHENINESVVLGIEENNDMYLCAYVVCKEELNHEEIRSYISLQIPDYMVPTYFVELESLPLNPNGKVNRKALPSPEVTAGKDYVAPSNATEERLVEIWSEVLNINKEAISVNANFFSIGGHSLKATVLTSKIHKEIGVEFPLREVFLHPTIKSQASQIEKSTKKEFVSIPKAKEQSSYPLSSAQKRLYLLQQFDLTSTVYNMPYIIPLGKEVDKSKIEEVFKQLINRHESFRTSINLVDQEPVQLISKDVEFELEELSIETREVENTRNKFIRAFDLSKAPFLRVAVIDIKGEDSLLMIDLHHIISDGTTRKILEQEFMTLFSGEKLAPLPLQYKDYSQWQNSKEQQELIKYQEQYWLTKFEGEIPVLSLPSDYVRPLMQSHEGAAVDFVLSKEETEGIRFFTKENDLTLYMSLLSVFNILLPKLSGQDDIVVGTPIAGRNHSDLENIVGMFVNTLSIRNKVKAEESIREFASSLKQTVLGAYENQNYQFEDLVEKVSVERDAGRNPIFDVMINLLNQAEHSGDISGIDNENLIHIKGVSKFDLSISVVDYGEQLLIRFEYCTQLFKAETIDRFIVYFKQIVGQLARISEIKISAIDILTEEEKHRLLYEFNDTKTDYPKDKTIHQLFEEQVEKVPNNIAVVHKGIEFTYQEINNKSNQLSRYLRDSGLVIGDKVSLLVERSVDMIIAIFGIVKAGGVYLPIDISYPESRIKYIIDNSDSKLVLSQRSNLDSIDILLPVYFLEEIELENRDTSNLKIDVKPTDLSYIIYTSGSTGKPKGVQIEHLSVVNLLYFLQDNYPIKEDDTYLLKTSYCFDVSISELFGWFMGGGRLSILEQGLEKDLEKIIETIYESKVTHINFVPTVFNLFSGSLSEKEKSKLNSLKYIMIAGEALKREDLNEFKKLELDIQIDNLYGPTEATVYSSYTTIQLNETEPIQIGKPIPNNSIYILDGNLSIQAIGVSGELCIGGIGLARAYLKNPELTKEKFIDHPFKEGERLYRTGDLARCLPDGNIEFLGRIDHQVKIRGFRIELGEIESVIQKYESIKESVVIAIEENNDKYLCAYIVSKEELNQEELRAYMSSQVPDYMVPSYFVELESLPLTANGKVNRKVLPSPEIKAGDDYVAPSNETEEKLAEIWSEVLNIEKEEISTTANFFELGGHSLKVLNVVSAIKEKFGINLPLMHIYRNSNIKTIAIDILSKEYASNDFEVHNNENNSKVFCFPPMVGYGLCFAEVAKLIPELCLYSFNYINTKDLVKFYADKIIEADNQGPYKLLGYSVGCKLVSLVAKELERRGMIVSDVILIDGYWNENDLTQFEEVNENEVSSELEKFLFDIKEYLKGMNMNFLIDETREKCIDYSRFISNIKGFEIINAKVHLIQARLEDEVKEEKLEKAHQMEQYTNDEILIYSGNGKHMDMLAPEFIEENVKIIRKCLSLVNCNTN